jgi:hypothetical protein
MRPLPNGGTLGSPETKTTELRMASNGVRPGRRVEPPTCEEARFLFGRRIPGGRVGRFLGLWLVLIVTFAFAWWLAAQVGGVRA